MSQEKLAIRGLFIFFIALAGCQSDGIPRGVPRTLQESAANKLNTSEARFTSGDHLYETRTETLPPISDEYWSNHGEWNARFPDAGLPTTAELAGSTYQWPRLLSRPLEMPYPDWYRRRNIELSLDAAVFISETGEVFKVEILRSSDSRIDPVAIDWFKQWRFAPAMLNGVPRRAARIFPVRWKLSDEQNNP